MSRSMEIIMATEDEKEYLEHLTVKCSVSAASEVCAAFVCVHRAEYFADGLDQPFNGSRGDSA